MGAQSQDRQRQSCSTISPSCMSPYCCLLNPPLHKPTSKLELGQPSLVSVLAQEDKLTTYSMEQLVILVLLVMLVTVSTLAMVSIPTPELGHSITALGVTWCRLTWRLSCVFLHWSLPVSRKLEGRHWNCLLGRVVTRW